MDSFRFRVFFVLMLAAVLPSCRQNLDVVIRNGILVDGTGALGFKSDIGIRGDEIVLIQKNIHASAGKMIDAAGQVVSPGFIDIHTHCEDGMDKPETRANLNYLMQGTTSVVTGNCGDGTGDITRWSASLDSAGIGTNVIPLTGFGWLRMQAMGREDRAPSAEELEKMKELLAASMNEGSWGLSTGLQYVPQKYAGTEEIIAIASVMAGTGGIYATHMRSEEDQLVEATREAIRIASETDLPLNIAHLKANGRSNFGSMAEVFRLVEEAQSGGLKVTADMYPYDKSSTTSLVSVLLAPNEMGLKNVSDWQAALRDPSKKEMIRSLTEKGRPGETNWVAKGGWNYFSIVDAPGHPEYVNRMIIDLAFAGGITPFELAAQLVVSEGDEVIISLSTMDEENLKKQMVKPWVMFSSDGYAVNPASRGVHPRNYGSQARVLRKYVREEKILTLEQAVFKMTGLPALTLGLTDRGRISRGMKADLVIFDPQKINDPASFLKPHQYAEGVSGVIINGVPVIEDGRYNGSLEGRVLLKNKR
jgi:N-acyl-D-aspartate/D-glutamate deacylase